MKMNVQVENMWWGHSSYVTVVPYYYYYYALLFLFDCSLSRRFDATYMTLVSCLSPVCMCLSRVYFTCTVFLGFFTSSFNLGMVTWRTPSVKSAWTFDFYHRGFIRDKKTDKDFWFNIVDVGLPPSLVNGPLDRNRAFQRQTGHSYRRR